MLLNILNAYFAFFFYIGQELANVVVVVRGSAKGDSFVLPLGAYAAVAVRTRGNNIR